MTLFHGDSLKHGSSYVYVGRTEVKIYRQTLAGRSMLEDGARHVGLFLNFCHRVIRYLSDGTPYTMSAT
jgi:hypothetical protein